MKRGIFYIFELFIRQPFVTGSRLLAQKLKKQKSKINCFSYFSISFFLTLFKFFQPIFVIFYFIIYFLFYYLFFWPLILFFCRIIGILFLWFIHFSSFSLNPYCPSRSHHFLVFPDILVSFLTFLSPSRHSSFSFS